MQTYCSYHVLHLILKKNITIGMTRYERNKQRKQVLGGNCQII